MLVGICGVGMAGGDQRSDLLATHRPSNVTRSEKVKDLDGNFSFHAHRECGEIHHPKLLFDRVFKRQRVVPDGIVVFSGISVVDTINFGGLNNRSTQFRGSKGCTGVGGKKGLPVPAAGPRSGLSEVSNRTFLMNGSATEGMAKAAINRDGCPICSRASRKTAHSACPACPCNRQSPEQSDLAGPKYPHGRCCIRNHHGQIHFG